MEHKGNIIHLDGFELPEVDRIIGGSPCQDLSVAGKRAGLAGERSGLFMEQIRIVKEMRLFAGKPRFMVWENVPGALSSKKGEDFRVVLEEIVKVVDQDAFIPRPPGKWTTAGAIVGDGWSEEGWRCIRWDRLLNSVWDANIRETATPACTCMSGSWSILTRSRCVVGCG